MIKVGSINVCDLCGAEWLSKGGKVPGRCSRCKSSKWDEAGKREGLDVAQDSERVQAMLARSIEQDGIIAGLREEIRGLKRAVRTDRQVTDAVGPSIGSGQGKVTFAARDYTGGRPPAREIPPHSAHSGLHPKPGCEVCAELAKHPIKESGKGCVHPVGQRRGPMCLACSQPWSK